MKSIAFLVLLIILGGIGLTLYKVRTAEHDPAVWHVDPFTAVAATTPNHFRLAPDTLTEQEVDQESPVLTGDVVEIARAFDAFVVNQRETIRLAGSPEEAWMTYVQRTPRLKIPDYISVKFVKLPEEGKVAVAIFSRSRFGNGDMGVNEARVQDWLTGLQAFVE
jgi:hypothetical protein